MAAPPPIILSDNKIRSASFLKAKKCLPMALQTCFGTIFFAPHLHEDAAGDACGVDVFVRQERPDHPLELNLVHQHVWVRTGQAVAVSGAVRRRARPTRPSCRRCRRHLTLTSDRQKVSEMPVYSIQRRNGVASTAFVATDAAGPHADGRRDRPCRPRAGRARRGGTLVNAVAAPPVPRLTKARFL